MKSEKENKEKIKHEKVIREIIPNATNISSSAIMETVFFTINTGLHKIELDLLRREGYYIYFISVDGYGFLEVILSTSKKVEE